MPSGLRTAAKHYVFAARGTSLEDAIRAVRSEWNTRASSAGD
jgi:hypothetical protein